MAALHELVDAAFLTADAGTDFADLAGVGLVAPVGIGQYRTTQHDHVALLVPQCLLCQIGITQLAHSHNGDFHAHVGLDVVFSKVVLCGLRHIQETACGHPCGGMGKPPVVVAAQIHVEHIHTGFHQVLHVLQSLLHGTSVLKALQAGYRVHPVTVGFLQRQRQVNAVHNGVVRAGALTDLFDEVNAEALPVGVLAELAVIEGRAGQLIQ